MSTPRLSVSIVSYNSSKFLRRCLESLRTLGDQISSEIIVVDNASSDGSPDMVAQYYPEVRLIRNCKNRYFTGGHNQALAVASGQYFLILNSDVEVDPAAIHSLCHVLDANPNLGAVGCQERDAEGQIQLTGSRFPNLLLELARSSSGGKRWLKGIIMKHKMDDWDRTEDRYVEVLTDCFLVVRTELMRRLGGFNERLRLYFTEDDLCRRIWSTGSMINFVADCHYIHYKHQSTSQEPPERIRAIFSHDRQGYYRIHHGILGDYLVRGLVWSSRTLSHIVSRFPKA